MNLPAIPSSQFYGDSLNGLFDEIEARIEKNKNKIPVDYDYKPRGILEPSRHKEEFWKQNDALIHAAEHSKDFDVLCCFVFQDENGKRRFIVTYPRDFWEDTEETPMERRVFYEVL